VRIGFLVSGNKYTGAAAAAEHMTRAVLAAGGEAELAYTGGNNLERRLKDEPWASPALVKERRPGDLLANVRTVRGLSERCDVVVSHLPHDHALAVLARVHRRAFLVRNVRSERHLRSDPYHRWLFGHARAALLATGALARHIGRSWRIPPPWIAPPVPLEDRFRPGADGAAWRSRLGIPADAFVAGMVGKVAPGRGFDLLLEAAALVQPAPHVLLVGHGEAEGELRALADRLGIAGRVHWAGYEERGLPGLYAAMDVVLFPAAGSDRGHRAISEAQGCGRPVVAAAIPGVEDLVEDGRTGRIVPRTPEGLAAGIQELVDAPALRERLGMEAAAAVGVRRFRPVGETILRFLQEAAERHPRAGRSRKHRTGA